MRLVLMAFAGLAVGGAIATYQQRRRPWVSLLFLVVGGLLVWAAYSVDGP